ncbi:MAG: hypothetical protein ACRD0U_06155, partial [Acidimicrobiales bacterium]
MKTRGLPRSMAAVGAAFAAVLVGVFASGGETPDEETPAAEIITFYNDHATQFRIGAFALVLAAVLLLFFAGGLRQLLRSGEDDGGWGERLASVALGGAVMFAAGLATFAISASAMVTAADLGQPDVVTALNVVDNNNFFLVMVGMATMLSATGLRALQSGVLPR